MAMTQGRGHRPSQPSDGSLTSPRLGTLAQDGGELREVGNSRVGRADLGWEEAMTHIPLVGKWALIWAGEGVSGFIRGGRNDPDSPGLGESTDLGWEGSLT